MSLIDVAAGPYTFKARSEAASAKMSAAVPRPAARRRERDRIHVRWSGEGSGSRSAMSIWRWSKTTRAIRARRCLLIPAGLSETEIAGLWRRAVR